ncbi:MAG: hypothetical protein RL154_1561 [Pseudomonadota bacterium]|jgi:hypothetical protein
MFIFYFCLSFVCFYGVFNGAGIFFLIGAFALLATGIKSLLKDINSLVEY